MDGYTERSFYSNITGAFINQDSKIVQGEIQTNAAFTSPDPEQSNSWKEQICILKEQLQGLEDSKILFEYTIPRVGKRVDNILLLKNIVFVIEFKCGSEAKRYSKSAFDQVFDYALDLKFFQKESKDRLIVPILCCTNAPEVTHVIVEGENRILEPLCCNKNDIRNVIDLVLQKYTSEPFLDTERWIESEYCPVPTIIEAARALYLNHKVEEITRHDANIDVTTEEIDSIIDYSKTNHRKSICFVTGVPGAGKTLVGLNIAIEHSDTSMEEHATFLSGNGPLVSVLTEALARDKIERSKKSGKKTTKAEAKREVSRFIQIIHRYRDNYYRFPDHIPPEHVVIFDESQRAWTHEKMEEFMKKKKGAQYFDQSEPEFLIETMNRHRDWATIICLVGGGQEIYNGEAGLSEWFDSLRRSFKNWDVYVAPQLNDSEYCRDRSWNDVIYGLNVMERDNLHLPVSVRSFRTPDLSSFIKCLLDLDGEGAKEHLQKMGDDYPIFLTRDINTARGWVKSKSRGTTRYGLLASSRAVRLKPSGIFVKSSNDIVNWILGDKDDIRSSYFLEEVVTEFDIQGLEIDYSIVAWDADMRLNNGEWKYYGFRGNKWYNIHDKNMKLYIKNSYRVLLTRSRQGMIIYVPEGNDEDETRKKEFYDGTYKYLSEIGLKQISFEN